MIWPRRFLTPGAFVLPQVIQQTADFILDAHGEMLRDLMSAPDLETLQTRVQKFTPEAEVALEKEHVTGSMARRAFVDAVVRRWVKSHPTEKSPE